MILSATNKRVILPHRLGIVDRFALKLQLRRSRSSVTPTCMAYVLDGRGDQFTGIKCDQGRISPESWALAVLSHD